MDQGLGNFLEGFFGQVNTDIKTAEQQAAARDAARAASLAKMQTFVAQQDILAKKAKDLEQYKVQQIEPQKAALDLEKFNKEQAVRQSNEVSNIHLRSGLEAGREQAKANRDAEQTKAIMESLGIVLQPFKPTTAPTASTSGEESIATGGKLDNTVVPPEGKQPKLSDEELARAQVIATASPGAAGKKAAAAIGLMRGAQSKESAVENAPSLDATGTPVSGIVKEYYGDDIQGMQRKATLVPAEYKNLPTAQKDAIANQAAGNVAQIATGIADLTRNESSSGTQGRVSKLTGPIIMGAATAVEANMSVLTSTRTTPQQKAAAATTINNTLQPLGLSLGDLADHPSASIALSGNRAPVVSALSKSATVVPQAAITAVQPPQAQQTAPANGWTPAAEAALKQQIPSAYKSNGQWYAVVDGKTKLISPQYGNQ